MFLDADPVPQINIECPSGSISVDVAYAVRATIHSSRETMVNRKRAIPHPAFKAEGSHIVFLFWTVRNPNGLYLRMLLVYLNKQVFCVT